MSSESENPSKALFFSGTSIGKIAPKTGDQKNFPTQKPKIICCVKTGYLKRKKDKIAAIEAECTDRNKPIEIDALPVGLKVIFSEDYEIIQNIVIYKDPKQPNSFLNHAWVEKHRGKSSTQNPYNLLRLATKGRRAASHAAEYIANDYIKCSKKPLAGKQKIAFAPTAYFAKNIEIFCVGTGFDLQQDSSKDCSLKKEIKEKQVKPHVVEGLGGAVIKVVFNKETRCIESCLIQRRPNIPKSIKEAKEAGRQIAHKDAVSYIADRMQTQYKGLTPEKIIPVRPILGQFHKFEDAVACIAQEFINETTRESNLYQEDIGQNNAAGILQKILRTDVKKGKEEFQKKFPQGKTYDFSREGGEPVIKLLGLNSARDLVNVTWEMLLDLLYGVSKQGQFSRTKETQNKDEFLHVYSEYGEYACDSGRQEGGGVKNGVDADKEQKKSAPLHKRVEAHEPLSCSSSSSSSPSSNNGIFSSGEQYSQSSSMQSDDLISDEDWLAVLEQHEVSVPSQLSSIANLPEAQDLNGIRKKPPKRKEPEQLASDKVKTAKSDSRYAASSSLAKYGQFPVATSVPLVVQQQKKEEGCSSSAHSSSTLT